MWSWDFVTDQAENGSRFRILNIIYALVPKCNSGTSEFSPFLNFDPGEALCSTQIDASAPVA